jgi:ribonuclease VapC
VILDTSAILAVFLEEPEGGAFLTRIESEPLVGVGAPTLVETSIVLGTRLGAAGHAELARLVERAVLVVVPFDHRHWQAALDAWLTYGKGRHAAGLNLGDCLAYATARIARRPLLCKGGDFARTDIELA